MPVQRSPIDRGERLKTPGFGEFGQSLLFPLQIAFGEKADSVCWEEMQRRDDSEILVREGGALRLRDRENRDGNSQFVVQDENPLTGVDTNRTTPPAPRCVVDERSFVRSDRGEDGACAAGFVPGMARSRVQQGLLREPGVRGDSLPGRDASFCPRPQAILSVRKFDGRNFEAFESHFRFVCKVNQWNGRDMFVALVGALSDDALSEIQGMCLGGDMNYDVERALQHLRRIFVTTNELQAIVQFERVVQHSGESVTALKQRIEGLALRAYPELDDRSRQKHCVAAFLKAIADDEVRNLLLREKLSSLSDCVESYIRLRQLEETGRALSREGDTCDFFAIRSDDRTRALRAGLRGAPGDLESKVTEMEMNLKEMKVQVNDIARSTEERLVAFSRSTDERFDLLFQCCYGQL